MSAASRILLSIVAIVVAAAAVGIWILRGPGPMGFAGGAKVELADYRGADPTGVPAGLAQASLVERGAYLARAADCLPCHTSKDGKPYAGGLGFKLRVGTIYSTDTGAPRAYPMANLETLPGAAAVAGTIHQLILV